jgi:hypothetical protein
MVGAILLCSSGLVIFGPFRYFSGVAEIKMLVKSITAIVEDDPEGVAAAPCRVEILEPHTLIVHQPPGGYLLEDR